MELIAQPNAIEENVWLMKTYHFFEFESQRQMLIYFGVGIIALIGLTNIFSICTMWLQYSYSWNAAHHLSTRLLATYINKPYSYFLNTNTSELRTYIISEVNSLTGGLLIPVIELVSRTIVSMIIFSLIFWIAPKIALIMFGSLGGAYLIIYLSQKNFLKRIGHYRIEMNMLRYKSIQELLDGIKTVMVYNKDRFFYQRYHDASYEFCNVQPKYNILLSAPKFILEFLAFGSILAITIYLYIRFGDIQTALPRLSLYAVAGYRLLPALQRAFAAAAKIRHNYPVLERLHDDLVISLKEGHSNEPAEITPLPFHKSITFNNTSFKYENTNNLILEDMDLNINKGETIAFIGSTGSGKTTLIDLLVGLINPTSGSVDVDNVPLNADNVRSWRENIAYVPQEVFLFDDSVIRNISIDTKKDVDMERLKSATKMADIHDFIINELPEGFDTKIGEKGVRLSGGQRQRLGLARALYINPSVLILDEATSALDSITEKGIISSLKLLPKNITTIIIAHRLSTIRHADCIYFLKEGKIIDKGTYDSLIDSSPIFKTMVKLS
ncbi:MAG: ABC-type bacteriocin/lantibiotic exporter with double-glycine peptidase domain [Maribacter sp.]|jgi:ABC-type bacteriocin/lantibiotic exporter with double-glycine peptidase domain